jgi:hypothetical protein
MSADRTGYVKGVFKELTEERATRANITGRSKCSS